MYCYIHVYYILCKHDFRELCVYYTDTGSKEVNDKVVFYHMYIVKFVPEHN